MIIEERTLRMNAVYPSGIPALLNPQCLSEIFLYGPVGALYQELEQFPVSPEIGP